MITTAPGRLDHDHRPQYGGLDPDMLCRAAKPSLRRGRAAPINVIGTYPRCETLALPPTDLLRESFQGIFNMATDPLRIL